MAELYRQRDVSIDEKHPLFPWCDNITAKANNLSNAVRFRQRQVLTASKKPEDQWTDNERSVISEIQDAAGALARYKKAFRVGQSSLGYSFIDTLLKVTKNPDYYAFGLPAQTAQWTIKRCCSDMQGFFESIAAYKTSPGSFTGKPELPGYKRKGGHCTCTVTNQDAVMHMKDGRGFLKLPLTKIKVDFGPFEHDLSVSEVKVIPDNGTYTISLIYTFNVDIPSVKEPKRIASVDIGIDNLMSVVNNCGLPCLIYKGGIPKSINQLYNKKLSAIMQQEMSKPGCPVNKSGKPKFVPTAESKELTLRRNFAIKDFMHKTAKHLITWCVENRIDTVVVGVNKQWKQEVNLGHKTNQEFVQIPFASLRFILSYLCEENGINYVEQEESYTSKASFPDMDPIPVYDPADTTEHSFSGRRRPTTYKGFYKKGGFRGLYVCSDGTIINSDLNGAANILRKAFPNAFNGKEMSLPDFWNVVIIRHPDHKKVRELQARQKSNGNISRLKQKRLRRKGKTAA